MNKELKQFTITMESGKRFGGKYRDEAQIRGIWTFSKNKIAKIEECDIWTAEERKEMDADKVRHRAY